VVSLTLKILFLVDIHVICWVIMITCEEFTTYFKGLRLIVLVSKVGLSGGGFLVWFSPRYDDYLLYY